MESNEKTFVVSLESPERIRLQELEHEGRWVFHGSGLKLEELQPRQAYTYKRNSQQEEVKVVDGKPAVFASPFADIAIFMAIINRKNVPGGSKCGFSSRGDGGIDFRATRATLDQVHNALGYVYVFDKEKFTPRSSYESLAYETVIPDEVIIVTEKDLPEQIDIKDF